MQVSIHRKIHGSFQTFIAREIYAASDSKRHFWQLETDTLDPSVTITTGLADDPMVRFHGTGIALDGDRVSGTVTSIEIFKVASLNRAVTVLDVNLDLGALQLAAEHLANVYGTQEYRDFLDLFMGDTGLTLSGSKNNDVIEAGQNGDTLWGGDGDDVFYLIGNADPEVRDVIDGGAGENSVMALDLDSPIILNLATGVLRYQVGDKMVPIAELTHVDKGFATVFDDILKGNSNDNRVFGHDGDDVILSKNGADTNFGGEGKDLIRGGRGRDYNDGGGGRDMIYGGKGGDDLAGYTGDDRLFGGAGADWISGGPANDILEGGIGDDVLWGGSGQDQFVFTHRGGKAGTGQDVIYDFGPYGDTILINSGGATVTVEVSNNGTDTTIDFEFGAVTLMGQLLQQDQIDIVYTNGI